MLSQHHSATVNVPDAKLLWATGKKEIPATDNLSTGIRWKESQKGSGVCGAGEQLTQLELCSHPSHSLTPYSPLSPAPNISHVPVWFWHFFPDLLCQVNIRLFPTWFHMVLHTRHFKGEIRPISSVTIVYIWASILVYIAPKLSFHRETCLRSLRKPVGKQPLAAKSH